MKSRHLFPSVVINRLPKLFPDFKNKHILLLLWGFHKFSQRNSLVVPRHCSHHFTVKHCLLFVCILLNYLGIEDAPTVWIVLGFQRLQTKPMSHFSHNSAQVVIPSLTQRLRTVKATCVFISQLLRHPPYAVFTKI